MNKEQPGYDYLQCSDCQYDVVVEAGDKDRHCPLCIEDCEHYVKMTRRTALTSDRPEGPDARED